MAHFFLRLRRAVLFVFTVALLPARVPAADSDSTALLEFQRLAKEADFKQVETAFKAAHPGPPNKQAVEALVGTLVNSALRVMDEARRFQKQFPDSPLLAEVERRATE